MPAFFRFSQNGEDYALSPEGLQAQAAHLGLSPRQVAALVRSGPTGDEEMSLTPAQYANELLGEAWRNEPGGRPNTNVRNTISPEEITVQRGLQKGNDQRDQRNLAIEERTLGRNAPIRNKFEFARWQHENLPRQNVGSALASHQLNSFLNFKNDLEGDFESNTGPYGQLQHALTLQKPYNAQEKVAGINANAERDIAFDRNRVVGQLGEMLDRRLDSMGLSDVLGSPKRRDPSLKKYRPGAPVATG